MFLTIIIYLLVDDLNNIDIILEVELFIRFFSNLEIILEIKLKNFIISFFDISFNLIYIYICVCVCVCVCVCIIIIFIHHDLKNLMNSSSTYLLFVLCKSSTNKYMIMVKKRYRKNYEKYDITIFFFFFKLYKV